jgi:hypothetical protein
LPWRPCEAPLHDQRLIYDVLTPASRLDPDANVLLTDGSGRKGVLYYQARYQL